MPHSSAFRHRLSARHALGVALIAALLPASRGEAQGSASSPATRPKAAQPLPGHRLTAPMVRQVSAVMRDWNPLPPVGAVLFGAEAGMSEEEFEALPDSAQQWIIVENMVRSRAKEKEGRQHIEQLMVGGLDERSAAAERVPALKTAIARAGLSTGEFVAAFDAYYTAISHLLSEEMLPDGTRPLEPGVRKDNVELMRPMAQAEDLWSDLAR